MNTFGPETCISQDLKVTSWLFKTYSELLVLTPNKQQQSHVLHVYT